MECGGHATALSFGSHASDPQIVGGAQEANFSAQAVVFSQARMPVSRREHGSRFESGGRCHSLEKLRHGLSTPRKSGVS